MDTQHTLLIELGTEELPPKALDELAQAFASGVAGGLAKRGIAVAAPQVRTYSTPRRLAVQIEGVPARQPDQLLERRGPACQAGLDAAGQPTAALLGFARSCGVEVGALEKLETDKGAWFVHRARQAGGETARLLSEITLEALKALPIPKPMRWGNHEFAFIRPVHWLVMLLDDRVVDAELWGLKADRMSRGHRFHAPKPVWIADARQYQDALRAAFVLVDPQERRAAIVAGVDRLAQAAGGHAHKPPALIEEVKNLVEWPVAIACSFDPEFLQVPAEALMTTMETNQKFFPVLGADGQLSAHFIGVANIESRDPEQVRRGYERVIRPRFADAKFFVDEDLKVPLQQHQKALEAVTYHQRLGSVWDKVCRVGQLALYVAKRMQDRGATIDPAQADWAARLYKCDLMTRMVGEFPELQGVMGHRYALAQGVPAAVARAIEESYWPRFAGDAVAKTPLGQALAIAEKLDTLASLFVVGAKPSGNKDPFSLRRQALGLARTLIEGQLDLDVRALLLDAVERAQQQVDSLPAPAGSKVPQPSRAERVAELYDFLMERLRSYYGEQGIAGEAFDAVLALRPDSLFDFDRRLRAVVAFAGLPEAAALAAANKRIGNILRQAAEAPAPVDVPAADDGAPEEFALAEDLKRHGTLARQALERSDYLAALKQLAALRDPVDRFFERVMVMTGHAPTRARRLALLADLRNQFLSIADIGMLQAG